MCFRGNFSGGTSAKDKGHWGHREWFLCSSGFQIIQGWYKGAFCLSFPRAPHSLYLFTLSLIEFPSLQRWPSVQRQPRPNQTFPFSAVCSNLRRFHQALHCSPPPKRQHPHKSHSRQHHPLSPSLASLSPSDSLSLSSPLWLCRCRKNTEVIIEMFLFLKKQELDLLGLMAVLKR